MSDTHNNAATIHIMGKTYSVKCPLEKISELRESAQYLEEKMRQLGQSSKMMSLDRLAVIAALNITHELLLQKKQTSTYIEVMNQHICDLQHKVEASFEHED